MTQVSLKPYADRILISLSEPEKVTPFGLHLPDNVKQEGAEFGEVVSVGDGVCEDVRPGDRAVFKQHSGADIGDGLLILQESEILAVIRA